MSTITVLIQTYNEEKHIEACITSAKLLTDTILVVDTESTDATRARAKNMGATVITFPFSQYVEPAREFGIHHVTTEWVFILDADERITPQLAAEIRSTLHEKHSPTHYRILRKNMFGGIIWLQHGGWWPDAQLRLFQKLALTSWPARIHATPSFTGQEGILKEAFEHHFHGDVHSMAEKTITYEGIEAHLLYDAKKPVNTLTFFRKFLGELFRRLMKKQGYKDGPIGVFEAFYQAYSKTITYLFLWEKYEKDRSSL